MNHHKKTLQNQDHQISKKSEGADLPTPNREGSVKEPATKQTRKNTSMHLKIKTSRLLLWAGFAIVVIGLLFFAIDVGSTMARKWIGASEPLAMAQADTATPEATATQTRPPTDTATVTNTVTPTETEEPTILSALVAVDNAILRSGPGVDHPEISEVLAVGSQITVLSTEPTQAWFRVETENGLQGWLLAEWLSFDFEVELVALEDDVPTPIPTHTPTPTATKTPPPPTATDPPPPPPPTATKPPPATATNPPEPPPPTATNVPAYP
jgi:uncharacterized protein YraI